MKPKIIYVFDALCAWCYGFSPVMTAIYEYYRDEFDFEVISAGMNLNRAETGDQETSQQSLYTTIEEITGTTFGTAFLHSLAEGGISFNSEVPAVALSVFKSIYPKKAVEFAHHIQNSVFYDGKDPADPELYRYISVNFGIDPDTFEKDMHEPKYLESAHYDFALAKQLQVSSYPAVLIQVSDSQFYLVAKGYADYTTMELRINNVKKEAGI